MMIKSLWFELEPFWPDGFWDEFMRLPSTRKNRQCIRPEITRTFTFGEFGVSDAQFYDAHLKKQFLNDVFINFTKLNLEYLDESYYEKWWIDQVFRDTVLHDISNIKDIKVLPTRVRLEYSSPMEYSDIAQFFHLLPDLKEGIPRMAFMGVVTFIYKNSRIFLYPKNLKTFQWKLQSFSTPFR